MHVNIGNGEIIVDFSDDAQEIVTITISGVNNLARFQVKGRHRLAGIRDLFTAALKAMDIVNYGAEPK